MMLSSCQFCRSMGALQPMNGVVGAGVAQELEDETDKPKTAEDGLVKSFEEHEDRYVRRNFVTTLLPRPHVRWVLCACLCTCMFVLCGASSSPSNASCLRCLGVCK